MNALATVSQHHSIPLGDLLIVAAYAQLTGKKPPSDSMNSERTARALHALDAEGWLKTDDSGSVLIAQPGADVTFLPRRRVSLPIADIVDWWNKATGSSINEAYAERLYRALCRRGVEFLPFAIPGDWRTLASVYLRLFPDGSIDECLSDMGGRLRTMRLAAVCIDGLSDIELADVVDMARALQKAWCQQRGGRGGDDFYAFLHAAAAGVRPADIVSQSSSGLSDIIAGVAAKHARRTVFKPNMESVFGVLQP